MRSASACSAFNFTVQFNSNAKVKVIPTGRIWYITEQRKNILIVEEFKLRSSVRIAACMNPSEKDTTSDREMLLTGSPDRDNSSLRNICSPFYLLYRFLIGLLYLTFQVLLCLLQPVKVNVVVSGPTLNSHQKFMRQLNVSLELCRLEECRVILVFCPIVSRLGTDMEASVRDIPDDKPVILVLMHHSYTPDHVDDIPIPPPRSNVVKVVQCVFHQLFDSAELLDCELNHRAIREVGSKLNQYI